MAGLGHPPKGYLLIFLVALLLVGLPIAVWLDLSNLVETNLRRQANDVNSIISSMRHYYANNVVGRILASPGTTKVVHNYKDYPGAIPIPATLSRLNWAGSSASVGREYIGRIFRFACSAEWAACPAPLSRRCCWASSRA